jgi:L-cysteine desulfidase
MERSTYENYVSLLKSELVPAMGCTEPISIAYAGALAKKYLFDEVLEVKLSISSNIIKNVKSVVVPNTGGLKGIYASVSCGILFGDSDKVLEVISNVGDSSRSAIEEFMANTKFSLEESKLNNNFDIQGNLSIKNGIDIIKEIDTNGKIYWHIENIIKLITIPITKIDSTVVVLYEIFNFLKL